MAMYNDNWLKDYVEALFQQQWGRNLSKYDGIQMLGGVTLKWSSDSRGCKSIQERILEDTYS